MSSTKHVFHALLAGVIGAICDACGVGRMSRYREKLIVVIKGQPLFEAAIHHFEQARCKLCGAIVRAEGEAASVAAGLGSSYITYDWSACAILLVMHYFAGLPYKRIESLHAGWGIPMPDANQWMLANATADLLFPLYKAHERHGIQNALALRIDDTGSMIVEVRREIRAEIKVLERLGESTKDVRTGINATGVYLETEQGKVLLFFTGRHHASEIIDQLLEIRRTAQSKKKLVKVSDAASKNFSHAHGDELEEAVCNAHAFLKFRAVKDHYPVESSLAGEVYKKVFDNDDAAAVRGMSPHQRMLHHREHSLPEMKRLKKMCSQKLEKKLVEPNSPLWEPLTFIINQWERLTKFCEVPARARSLQQFFDLERQPLLLLGHPLVGHRLVLARVRLHLRAIECDVSEPHQTCFLAKLQDFEEERFQCLQVDEPKLVDRREVGMTFSSQHPEWNVFVGRPRDPPRRIDAGAVGVQKQRDHHSRRVRSLASRVLGLDRDLDRAQLYLIDDVQDEVREMIFSEPLERGRREQERLSRSPRTVLLRHETMGSSPGVEVDPPNDRFQTKRPPRTSAGQSGRATAS